MIKIMVDTLGRPFSVNASLRENWRATHAKTKQWREHSYYLWKKALTGEQEGLWPASRPARVIVTPVYKKRNHIQDVAGCALAAKAVVDGAVDAGVLTDDNPQYLSEIVFRTHRFGRKDGLEIIIE